MVIIFSLLLALLLFLFTFYYYTRDDLYFIRKGVSMEQLFNILLSGLLGSLLFSRLLAIIFNLNIGRISQAQTYLSSRPLGISVFGAIAGLFLSYLLMTRKNKALRKRFFDYVSVSLLAALPILFLGVFINFYLFIMHIILFIFYVFVLVPKYNSGKMRTGSLCLIFLIMFSLVSFLNDIFLLYTQEILLSRESFLLVGLFIASCFFLLRLESYKTTKNSK